MKDIDSLSVYIASPESGKDSPIGISLKLIIKELENSGLTTRVVRNTDGIKDGMYNVTMSSDVVVIDWNLENASESIENIRSSDSNISIFLIAEPEVLNDLPLKIVSEIDEYLWVMGDSPPFIAGRIEAAARKYRKGLLPPMFKRLVEFSEDYEYSWHTPGHAAGVAFLKTSVGHLFYDFFGEQLFRSDLSISVAELGSLLDHSGPIGEAEKYAASVFGSDMTFFVTNGTSMSNRVVHIALTPPNGVELIDRNCHKSLEQAITMSHSIPVYMIPTRNRYGILGPILPDELGYENLTQRIKSNSLIDENTDLKPSVAVVTNSTYDGICCNAEKIERILSDVTDCIHFDEAWYGYARFNPLYAGRFGMRDDDLPSDERPTVITTQSTHKLLAALSQASMIHIKEGKRKLTHSIFNESYMMHASTSPQYAIIASLDVSSKMMDINGYGLTQDSIDEAIRFRQIMAKTGTDILEQNNEDWWFKVWQPDFVYDKTAGKQVPFEKISPGILGHDPDCWVLHPGDTWHGFGDIEENWAMLDPIKVTILSPGINDDGSYSEDGIPAALVIPYLDRYGIVNEKSGDYNILFLFSMGVTLGKWGTLMSKLYDFKKLYDCNAPVESVLPKLVSEYPERYSGMGLKQLAKEMHDQIKNSDQTGTANEACGFLPVSEMTPAKAYENLIKGNIVHKKLDDIENDVVATGIVPYPPGIPLLMPGENAGKKDGPILRYLRALEEFDRKFPGFEHDSHGVEVIDGDYYIYCIRGGCNE